MKKFLYIVIAIIALFLIVAAFVPKDFAVVRTIEINQPKTLVFDYIKYLKNQDNFSKWANMDPDMKKIFKGEDGNAGFVSRWESEDEDVGIGEQEITKIVEGERIEYELRFEEPWESVSPAYMTVESLDSAVTKVDWSFRGHMDYPSNIVLLFLNMEENLGNDLQEGLFNLKEILE